MSSSQILILLLFILISISDSSSSSSAFTSKLVGADAGRGRRVGGRTEIMNVESNREVQELGRFCVEQYNRKFRSGTAPLLAFSSVVAGEKQVVSGIKYYLRIAARDRRSGSRRLLFDAVVVVKPWEEEDRDLVSFAPAAAGYWK